MKYQMLKILLKYIGNPYAALDARKELSVLLGVVNWVDINESLPEVGEWVLCGHNKDDWVDRGTMNNGGVFANDECDIYPTHWSKLPAPPCL